MRPAAAAPEVDGEGVTGDGEGEVVGVTDGDTGKPVSAYVVRSTAPGAMLAAGTQPKPRVLVDDANAQGATAHCGRRQPLLAVLKLPKLSAAVLHTFGQAAGLGDTGPPDGDGDTPAAGELDGELVGEMEAMSSGTHE